MDAKKCDRCGRFYEEYGDLLTKYSDFLTNGKDYEIKKSSMIRVGTESVTGKFVCESHFDLCPLCMDELNKFLTDPNAFQCLGNCNECENANDCEAPKRSKEIEAYRKLHEEKNQ